jgi:hypothetical protein
MANHYILDTRLAGDHYVICSEAIRQGIIEPDDLNEGRRTMAEQWHFFRNQPPLAARPWVNAPHIWAGRNNHAIDSNSYNGAARRLANFYESLGIDVAFNVPGEDWHFQPLDGRQLRRAADKIRHQRDNQFSKRGEREKRVKFFKHQLHTIQDPQTKHAYYRPGQPKPKDGYDTFFNDDLYSAVKAFQKDHKLTSDGVIGPKTNHTIDKAYAKEMKRRRASARVRAQARKAKVARGETL